MEAVELAVLVSKMASDISDLENSKVLEMLFNKCESES